MQYNTRQQNAAHSWAYSLPSSPPPPPSLPLSLTHLQFAPAARPEAARIRGANSVGPEKYTADTQSLYAYHIGMAQAQTQAQAQAHSGAVQYVPQR
jgi:hypothetical protein